MLTKILVVIILALAVGAGVLGFVAYERGLKLDTAAAQHKADQATITTCNSAAADNAATVTDLQARLDKAAGQLADVQQAQAEAQQQAASAAKARDTALAQLREARTKLYATDQDAAAWSRGTVPAALSAGLRGEWNAAAADHP